MQTLTLKKKSSLYTDYLILITVLICNACYLLFFGETPLSEVMKGVFDRIFGAGSEWNCLLDERIPRLIVILCTGSALAVSGAVMQSLFQNPLASPSVLGITFGGSLMVTLVFILEWHYAYPYTIPLAAFLGCILTLLLVFGVTKCKGDLRLDNLILTGIAISSFLLAIQGALTYALRDRWHLIQMLTEWEAGSTANRCWKHVHMQLPLTLIGLRGCWKYRYEIDLLSLGEEEALNLGVDVPKVRWHLFLCVSMMTGGALASVGIVSFFGLILPHILRTVYGPQNIRLIPLCTIGGGAALMMIDNILRFYKIQSFSIGNISAIIGSIFFLFLLLKKKRG